MTLIYVPADRPNYHIRQVDIEDVMPFVDGNPGDTKWCSFEYPSLCAFDLEVDVNLGNSRYHVFKRDNLTCQCCGIRANCCYLDEDKQNSTPERPLYHFNFFAECADKDKTFRIFFEKSHIITPSQGGSDSESDLSNYQTLCFNCNKLKGVLNVSNELLRHMMFNGYRAYKSSKSLNRAKQETEKTRKLIEKHRNTIVSVNEAIKLVSADKVPQLTQKIERCREEIVILTNLCDEYELQAQKTGLVPEFKRN